MAPAPPNPPLASPPTPGGGPEPAGASPKEDMSVRRQESCREPLLAPGGFKLGLGRGEEAEGPLIYLGRRSQAFSLLPRSPSKTTPAPAPRAGMLGTRSALALRRPNQCISTLCYRTFGKARPREKRGDKRFLAQPRQRSSTVKAEIEAVHC